MDNFLVCGSPVTVLKDGDGPVIFFVTDRGEEAQVLPELEAQTAEWKRSLPAQRLQAWTALCCADSRTA